jgi:NAD(P)-dependent dehydrogenase (short-subunit alcohol dehydrogenase family)
MDGPFSGRVALITGASGGIGQAPARRSATGGAVPGLG